MSKLAHRARNWHAFAFSLIITACGPGAGTEAPAAPQATLPATGGTVAIAPATMANTGAAGKPSATAASAVAAAGAPAATAGTAAPVSMQPTAATAAGSTASMAAATAGSPAANSGGAAGAAGAKAPVDRDVSVPCAVTKALANACHKCHGTVPANGAPMALVTMKNFQTLSVGKPQVPLYQVALKRMDGSRGPIMPPGGAISPEDKKTLIDWFTSDIPAASGEPAICP